MAEILKGVSPNAEIVVNEHGGKQSKTAYGFHLIDAPITDKLESDWGDAE